MEIINSRSISISKLAVNTAAASTFIAALVLIVLFSCTVTAQTEDDSSEVYKLVNKYQDIWDSHDASALGAFFTEDADFIMGNIPLIQGRDGIRKWWSNYFKRQESERKLIITVNSFRIIAPGIVLLNVSTATGDRNSQGAELPTRKARGTWVLCWRNTDWLITAMRGMPTEEDRIIRKIGK